MVWSQDDGESETRVEARLITALGGGQRLRSLGVDKPGGDAVRRAIAAARSLSGQDRPGPRGRHAYDTAADGSLEEGGSAGAARTRRGRGPGSLRAATAYEEGDKIGAVDARDRGQPYPGTPVMTAETLPTANAGAYRVRLEVTSYRSKFPRARPRRTGGSAGPPPIRKKDRSRSRWRSSRGGGAFEKVIRSRRTTATADALSRENRRESVMIPGTTRGERETRGDA